MNLVPCQGCRLGGPCPYVLECRDAIEFAREARVSIPDAQYVWDLLREFRLDTLD